VRPSRDKNSRWSDFFPALVACIIFLAVKIGLDTAGTFIGIPSYIDYGYTVVVDHGLYEEEKDGSSTVKARSIRGDLDIKQRRVWAAWLIGISIYIVLSVAIDFMPIGGAFRWFTKLGLAAALFWLGRRIFEYFK